MHVYRLLNFEKGNSLAKVFFGSEVHGKPSFHLWVEMGFIKKGYVNLPAQGYIKQTQSGALILKPATDTWVGAFYVPCGYRGGSEFSILTPTVFAKEFEEWRSPRGRLGISRGALFVTDADKVVVKWKRWGRLYGEPSYGISVLFPDGTYKHFPVEELSEVGELAL